MTIHVIYDQEYGSYPHTRKITLHGNIWTRVDVKEGDTLRLYQIGEEDLSWKHQTTILDPFEQYEEYTYWADNADFKQFKTFDLGKLVDYSSTIRGVVGSHYTNESYKYTDIVVKKDGDIKYK